MGRRKVQIVDKSPLHLRRRKLSDGRESLFLDYFTGNSHKYEFLKLYLLPETSTSIKRQNLRTLRKADDILRERLIFLIDTRAKEQNKKEDKNPLLHDWMDTCAERHRLRGLKNMKSIRSCRNLLDTFQPNVRIKDIDKRFCLDLIFWLRNIYISPLTNKLLSARSSCIYCQIFNMAINEAIREGFIKVNPMSMVNREDKIKVPIIKREFLTIKEVRKLIETPCDKEIVKSAFLFSCFTGLRFSDICDLKWGDVHKNETFPHISIIIRKTQMPLTIPLSKMAIKCLPKRVLSNQDKVFFLMPNAVNKYIREWVELAGINKYVTYHASRHTFATMMLTLGADIYTISKLLGHKDVSITAIYAKIIDKKKDEAVNRIDKIFDSLKQAFIYDKNT